jgi:ferrous iron transport protein A
VAPRSAETTTLDLLPPLQRAMIVAVEWAALAPEEAKRLRAMGIDEGAEVAVAHRGIFWTRDPIALTIGRMTVAVRRAHARAMTVAAL